MLSKNHLRQLSQMEKHWAELFANVETSLSDCPEQMEPGIIYNGMLRLMEYLKDRPAPVVKAQPIAVPGKVIFDLIVCVEKFGRNSINTDGRIRWMKLAGQDYDRRQGRRLYDPGVQDYLMNFGPNPTMEIQTNQVLYKYQRSQ